MRGSVQNTDYEQSFWLPFLIIGGALLLAASFWMGVKW